MFSLFSFLFSFFDDFEIFVERFFIKCKICLLSSVAETLESVDSFYLAEISLNEYYTYISLAENAENEIVANLEVVVL